MLNDLWFYDGNRWVYVYGPKGFTNKGVYGVKGQASPNNYPGGRKEAVGTKTYQIRIKIKFKSYCNIDWFQILAWVQGGNFWLFGGFGYATATELIPGNSSNYWNLE